MHLAANSMIGVAPSNRCLQSLGGNVNNKQDGCIFQRLTRGPPPVELSWPTLVFTDHRMGGTLVAQP